MFPGGFLYPHLSFAFALLIPGATHGVSAISSSPRHHRPSLVSDLRTAWDGLLTYRSPELLWTRAIANATTTSQTGSVHCKLGSNLSSPGSLARGSDSVTSADLSQSSTVLASSPSESPRPTVWKMQKNHSGNSFFDGWTFFTGPDPTHGNVQFVDENTARSTNLSYINGVGNAVMAVDTTQTITGNRRAIRITTDYEFTGGLLVLDAVHAPTGCGTWPAFWSNGPTWPDNGEIDIVEGVNDVSVNQASIHTAPGCSISPSSLANNASGILVGGSDCASAESNNGGCGQLATPLPNSYGPGFNDNGGGVYAMLWDESGVSVYFFSRRSIPPDIPALRPQPQGWGTPFARWPATDCNPFQYFQQHRAIFDTTLCGDWAGNAWSTAGPPGQEQSCAERTGFSSCTAFVQNSGSSFTQAYWEVQSVRLYQKHI